MRKLVFKLNLHPAKRNREKNLGISTHYGSRILINYDKPCVLDVTEDSMTDGELLEWYRFRYSKFGLRCNILKDEAVNVSHVTENNEPEFINVSDSVQPLESADNVSKVVKKDSTDKVDSMSYSEMIQFAKDHNIEVNGRAKELYVEALKRWFEAHD